MLLSDRVVTMTNGPAAKIGEVLDVKLSRPRRRLELVSDPSCVAAREGGVPAYGEKPEVGRKRRTKRLAITACATCSAMQR